METSAAAASPEKPKQKRQYTKRKKAAELMDTDNAIPEVASGRKRAGRKSSNKALEQAPPSIDSSNQSSDVYSFSIDTAEAPTLDPPQLIPQENLEETSPQKKIAQTGQKRRASGAPKAESAGKRGRKSATVVEELPPMEELKSNGKEETVESVKVELEPSPPKVTTIRSIKPAKAKSKPLQTLIKKKKGKSKELDEEDQFEDPEYRKRSNQSKDVSLSALFYFKSFFFSSYISK
ncbi:hypothetical protein Ciccas_001420 [Cichlidogyrus casuarinus]|uniref:Uncharacterized protein n=1 Tax=Cichlidogyrus casuarinus TaxID=1844966 RepID=A0ABD2QLA4_9PLAT